jgi:hypothetical protein
MPSPPAELTTLLAKLATSGAEFVLVGGLAAVAQGAPLTTQDVDVVHRRTAENVDRLLLFLAGINAAIGNIVAPQSLPRGRHCSAPATIS